MLLDFWNETFLVGSGSVLAAGIGIALVPQLLVVEYQLAQYTSGLVQNLLLTVLIFLPVIRWRGAALKPAGGGALGNRNSRLDRAFRPL